MPPSSSLPDHRLGANSERLSQRIFESDHSRGFGRGENSNSREASSSWTRDFMTDTTSTVEQFAKRDYKYGFVTDIEQETIRPGLDEDVIRLISEKKGEPQWLTEWRLKAYRHWLTMKEPEWQNVHYPPIDYQKIAYYSAPKK